ncbi:MAG TPA: EAL domain-containing protein [Beijerinckiaceae bacterium]|nr:EAL domain-containing protein [Beijerinckiaceae bacterium]
MFGLVMVEGKRDADHLAKQAAANIADTIEHDTARTFEIYDLSLQGVLQALSEPEIARLTGKARQTALFDYAARATYFNAILVLDENGKIVDDSNLLDPPGFNLADRDYFQVQKENPDAGLYFSRPLQSRYLDGDWTIAISRRLSKPDGSFGGAVVGTLQLDYFQSLFSKLALGPGGEVTVFRSDGVLLARKPFQLRQIGRNHGSNDLFRRYPATISGQFESTSHADGIARRFTYTQVGNLPLVVSVGFAISDIYGPWRQKALLIGALMTGLILAIMALATLFAREFTKRKVAHAWLRDAFEAIPTGLVLLDAQDRFVLWNKSYVQSRTSGEIKVGMRYEDALRNATSRGVIPAAVGREEEWLKERLRRHNSLNLDNVVRRPDGRWIRVKETLTPSGVRIGMRIDITDLKNSEESFRILLEKNPLPMWVYEHETFRFLTVNDAAIEHYGYSREQFLSMTVLDIRNAEEREKLLAYVPRGKSDFSKTGRVRRHRKANGTEIDVAIYARHLQFEGRAASIVAAIDVTEQLRAERRLAHYARHDPLTNLGNRRAFSEHIESAFAESRVSPTPFAILCIDLDRFKEINDGFGHPIGDEILCEVARRLERAAGGAFVARMGGDEFAIVTGADTNATAVAQIADRVHANLAESFGIRGQLMHVRVSIGVAAYPADGQDEQTLMCNADAALYRAKTEGRGITCFFRPEMDLQLRERHALQRDLALAVAREELAIYYQPQASIDGRIFGFEALVRWRHHDRGMVGPDVFIPLAEENGLIVEIGEWILREACREAASWPNPLNIAVNLSPIQFRHNDLAGLVHTILLETGLSPNRLELEITEGVMIHDHAGALTTLRRLKALGVGIAMDDFGSGYSSLSYLQSFPFDKIKIDRSFVGKLGVNPQSMAIVRAVIGLGRGLQIPILAEGVETESQRAFLVEAHCDEMQGYLLGYPLPIDDYAELIGRAELPAVRRFVKLS